MFNIFLAALFYILNVVGIAIYADDNTPYVIADDISGVIALFSLKIICQKVMLTTRSSDAVSLRGNECDITNSEKLLGVKFGNKLTFEKHINDICRKASKKIDGLARIAPYMELSKQRMVMNVFFNWKFNNCLQIWMRHNRTTNRKLNRLHERCLRIIYNDKQISLPKILKKIQKFFFKIFLHFRVLRIRFCTYFLYISLTHNEKIIFFDTY